jgi:DeoR family galactitol utilization operon repressor
MHDSVNVVGQISRDRADLSRAFRAVADFLASDPEAFIRNPLRDLSEAIGVSEPTLIRFSRHYGFKGFPDLRLAVAMSLAASDTRKSEQLEPNLTDKEVVNRRAKRAIAEAAFALIDVDSSILLDSGSTVKILAELLVSSPSLTILTTGLNTLLVLKNCGQHKLILPGGVLRPEAMSLGGRMAEGTLSSMSFDTAYLGADSIHPEFGLSTFSEEEAHLNRAMIRTCRRVVVLADASKFRSPALHKICDLSGVDVLVTDTSLPSEIQQSITDKGPKLMLADLPKAAPPDEKANE